MDIGERIKQLRISKDLTQEELANRCELSKGFISQIERNLNSPSLETLIDILECLGTNLKDFFNDEETSEKIVFSKEDVFVQENEGMNHIVEWIIPNAQKNEMEPIILHLAKDGESDLYTAHKGEIFGYILKGEIKVVIGNQTYIAKENESFYFRATNAHYLKNNAKKESSVLWVSTPPSF